MAKLIRIRWRSLVLFFLAILGIIFWAIGWSGIPQRLMNNENATAPAATLAAESESEGQPAGDHKPTSPATANIVKMPGEMAAADNNGADYFIDSRLGRQRARGQQLETLRTIINNPASDREIRTEAQQALMTISKNISREVELENLIRAKGFDDVVVYLKENGADVVVKSDGLTPEEAARICDLVARGTGISEQNVVIIPTKQ